MKTSGVFYLIIGVFVVFSFASKSSDAKTTRSIIAGQLMLQHPVHSILSQSGSKSPSLTLRRNELNQGLDGVAKVFSQADVALLELESAPKIDSPRGYRAELRKETRSPTSPFFHQVDIKDLVDLLEKRFGLNSRKTQIYCANNHSSDNGAPGIERLQNITNQEGQTYQTVGIGFEAEASQVKVMTLEEGEAAGQRVASIAFATDKVALSASKDQLGVNTLHYDQVNGRLDRADEERILKTIVDLNHKDAILFVYHHDHSAVKDLFHSGAETPQWRMEFARKTLDAGADVYHAHGDPRLQGIEIYRGKNKSPKPIFYGLGSFFFQTINNYSGSEVWESVLIELEHGSAKVLKNVKISPILLNSVGIGGSLDFETRGIPTLVRGEKAFKILKRLQVLSNDFKTILEIHGEPSDPGSEIFATIDLQNSGRW